MASRLAAAGYPLHVYNRTRAKAEPLIEAARTGMRPRKRWPLASDVVLTIVGNAG